MPIILVPDTVPDQTDPVTRTVEQFVPYSYCNRKPGSSVFERSAKRDLISLGVLKGDFLLPIVHLDTVIDFLCANSSLGRIFFPQQ